MRRILDRLVPCRAVLVVAVLAGAACGGGGAASSATKGTTTGQPAATSAGQPGVGSATKSEGAPAGSPAPAAKATVAANPSSNKSGKPLLLADSFSNSGQYPYYVAIAKVANENAKSLNVTVVESGGAVENIRRFSRKELDFGLASGDVLRAAYNGEGEWQGKPQQQMRFMWVYGVAPNIFWVTEASGVKGFADLEGKSFSPGSRGSNTEQNTEKLLTILGVKPNYFRGSIEDALNAVRDRRVIGWAKTASGPMTPDPTTLEVGSTQPIRCTPASSNI